MDGKEQVYLRGVRGRYLLALAFIVFFIAVLFVANAGIRFVVVSYFPALDPYLKYVVEISQLAVAVLGTYIVYKILLSVVSIYGTRRNDVSTTEILKVVLRVLFYFVVISTILSAFGFSLTEVLAGGAIGGIVLGLAVQTIVASILSGFLVYSSKTVVPGEVLVMHSLLWGDILCRVNKVSMIHTEVVTNDGSRMNLPNTMLFNSSTFTRLRAGDSYSYTFQVVLKADIPLKGFDKRVSTILRKELSLLNHRMPRFYLHSKTLDSNTYRVTVDFDRLEDINRLISLINSAFDDAYWSVRR